MKLSAPVHRLKRKARLLSREERIPLHEALDRIASTEGYAGWSLLSAKAPASAKRLFAELTPGDLLLVGARPGQGKTLLGLKLAVEAMKASARSVFFTLEFTEKELLERLRAIGVEQARFERSFRFDGSDEISAEYIMKTMATAPRGTLAVIDYLQLLDRKRSTPELDSQIQALKLFALKRGLVFVFISQIDRSYDPATKPVPDVRDIRLPNPLDVSLFSKTCFLNDGHVRFDAVG